LIGSLSYSQEPLLVKTQYQGKNAFIGNEIVMDSIFSKYKAYEFLTIKNDSLSIKYNLNLLSIEKLKTELALFKKKSENLNNINSVFGKRFENQNQQHETELLYYKEKAKGKFKAFLYGTAIGGIIVAILTLL